MSKDRTDEILAIAEQVRQARDHSCQLGLRFEANLLDMAVEALEQLTKKQSEPQSEPKSTEPE